MSLFSISKGLITVWRIGSYLGFKATLTSNLFESVLNKSRVLFVSLDTKILQSSYYDLEKIMNNLFSESRKFSTCSAAGKIENKLLSCYGLIFFKFQFICRIHFILNLILLN